MFARLKHGFSPFFSMIVELWSLKPSQTNLPIEGLWIILDQGKNFAKNPFQSPLYKYQAKHHCIILERPKNNNKPQQQAQIA